MIHRQSEMLPRRISHPWSSLSRPALEVSWVDATTVRLTPVGPGGVARLPMENAAGSLYYDVTVSAATDIDLSTTGAGALDTGAIAAEKSYDIYAIAKADGTVAGLAVISGDTPVLPTGYVYLSKPLWVAHTPASAATLSEWGVPQGRGQPDPKIVPLESSAGTTLTANDIVLLTVLSHQVGVNLVEQGFAQCRFLSSVWTGADVIGVSHGLWDGKGGNSEASETVTTGNVRQQVIGAWISIKGGTNLGIYRANGDAERDNNVSVRIWNSDPGAGANDSTWYALAMEVR